MSCRCCLRLTMCGCHDHTLTELSSLRLQSPWEMSGRFPDGSLGSSLWGHLAVVAMGIEESMGSLPPPLLKVFVCLPAGYWVFCPPPSFSLCYLLRTKQQVLNILSCLSLPSAGFMSVSQHVWLPLAFFYFSLKSNFTPSLHSYAKPLWGSLLETFALISELLFLLKIWQHDFSLQVCHAPQWVTFRNKGLTQSPSLAGVSQMAFGTRSWATASLCLAWPV